MNTTPIPSTLDEAVDQFDANVPAKERDWIASVSLDQFRGSIHFFGGMSLRNRWRLWETTGPLNEQLQSLGFHNGDDKSGLLLALFWSRIHGQTFDIAAEAESNRVHWAKHGVNPDGLPL